MSDLVGCVDKECREQKRKLLEAAKAHQALAVCYRLRRRPSEKLFARLAVAETTIGSAEAGQ